MLLCDKILGCRKIELSTFYMSEKLHPKHLARIAAVQYLYQVNVLAIDVSDGLDYFVHDYLENEEFFKDINLKFFKKLVWYYSNDIDYSELLSDYISSMKKFEDSAIISQNILKLAISEISYGSADIPVIINEYVEISKRFLDMKSARFINAVLDQVSKKIQRSV